MKAPGIYSLILLLLLAGSCKKDNRSKQLLDQALKNKDYATAAFAYNQLLLEDSTHLGYKDSLARIYIKSGNFEGGLRLGEQVLAKQPQNHKLLELVSVANGQLKRTDKSVSNLNALFAATKDYTYLYKISGVYFDNGQFEKADSVCDKVIEGADSTKKVEINLPNGGSQTVSIMAACYNMKGAILTEMAEITQNGKLIQESIPYFQKAMQLDPEFAYPRLYLEKIAQFMQQR